MARATFTNDQLCSAWAKAKAAGGTRSDVVNDLMGQMDSPDATYRKVYNNVTQRRKQLGAHPTNPIVFPTLAAGKKGARRTDAQMAALQALLDAPPETEEEEVVG